MNPRPAQNDSLVLLSADRRDLDSRTARRRLLFRFIRQFVRPHLPLLLGAAFAMLMFAGTVTALPWLFERLVDEVFVKRDQNALNLLIILVMVLFTVRAGAAFSQQFLLARAANRIATSVQSTFSNHVLTLDLAFFHKNSIGQIVARGTEDVNVLNQSATNLLIVSVRDLVSLIGLIGYVLLASPQWFALTLLGGPLIAIPTVFATRKIRRLARQGQELNGDLIGAFEECFHAIRAIKVEGNESVERRRLGQTIGTRRSVQFKIARTQAMLMPVVDIVTAMALSAILMVGGASVMSGSAEPGKLMAFIGAFMLLYDPLKRLLQTNALLQTTMAAISRIYDVLDQRPHIVDAPDAVPLADAHGDIVFDRIEVGYEAHTPVLHEVSLTIPAGKTVAFVGPSGAGKTTILNLIARLNEPSRGVVRIGRQDLRGVELTSLRSNLAIVAQDALLFDATVRENIAYGSPEVSESEVIDAARRADAQDFIARLSEGYDFRVGPRGSRLSGGQRQRIVMARALLRNSPILMLDEATSALDSATEARILAHITEARRGKTTIMIAHRLATVIGADYIYMLEAGHITEQGTHAELLARGGSYAQAFALQSGVNG